MVKYSFIQEASIPGLGDNPEKTTDVPAYGFKAVLDDSGAYAQASIHVPSVNGKMTSKQKQIVDRFCDDYTPYINKIVSAVKKYARVKNFKNDVVGSINRIWIYCLPNGVFTAKVQALGTTIHINMKNGEVL